MLTLILFSFILYYLLSVYYFENLKGQDREHFLILTFTVVAVIIGIRNPNIWSDSGVYNEDYILTAKSIFELESWDHPGAYSEMGFYYIGVIAKTLGGNSTFYFLLVSAITMFCLYKGIKKYSLFPFLALFVYLGRFVARNTVQIRAALAIAIVIWGTVYITKRQWWKYVLVILFAFYFHKSMIIALPLCLMCMVKVKKWHVYVALIVSYIFAGLFGGAVNAWVSQFDLAQEWARSYVEEDSEKAWSNDLTNPMIWFQSFILVVYTYYEDVLKKHSEHYYTIRTAYLYSTIILVVLCQFATLAARLSTIFATYEMVMVPMFLFLFNKKNRLLPYLVICTIFSFFFYMNTRNYF